MSSPSAPVLSPPPSPRREPTPPPNPAVKEEAKRASEIALVLLAGLASFVFLPPDVAIVTTLLAAVIIHNGCASYRRIPRPEPDIIILSEAPPSRSWSIFRWPTVPTIFRPSYWYQPRPPVYRSYGSSSVSPPHLSYQQGRGHVSHPSTHGPRIHPGQDNPFEDFLPPQGHISNHHVLERDSSRRHYPQLDPYSSYGSSSVSPPQRDVVPNPAMQGPRVHPGQDNPPPASSSSLPFAFSFLREAPPAQTSHSQGSRSALPPSAPQQEREVVPNPAADRRRRVHLGEERPPTPRSVQPPPSQVRHRPQGASSQGRGVVPNPATQGARAHPGSASAFSSAKSSSFTPGARAHPGQS